MNLTKSNEKHIIPSSAREHASKQESLKENFLCWSPMAVIWYKMQSTSSAQRRNNI